MARLVIDVDVALRLVAEEREAAVAHELVAPTLLRSQMLETLYTRARSGRISEPAALALNARFAKLKARYLGDAVLRRRAWELAAQLDLVSTHDAEYLALTQLQGDALVAEDDALRYKADGVVTVLPYGALFS